MRKQSEASFLSSFSYRNSSIRTIVSTCPIFHFWKISFVALLLFCFSLFSRAQGCPELKTEDFNVEILSGNSDCHTPGAAVVTYRNNVVGFEKLVYELSKDNVAFAKSAESTNPSAPVTLPLTGWTSGETVYLRVTAYCGGATTQLALTHFVYDEKASAAVQLQIKTTPAGGCTATSGSLSVLLGGVTGFSEVEYSLYRDGSLLKTEMSTAPSKPVTFYNLPSGDFLLVARATPECTPPSPGAGWKDGAYEVSQTVNVHNFSIILTPISSRGTCTGGVTVRAARVLGVSKIKYEIFQRGGVAAGHAPLQEKETVYPAFTHSFLSLPLGAYEIRATADCGVEELALFDVTMGSAGTLAVSEMQKTYAHCAIGKIHASVPGTSVACPVNYELIRPDGTSIHKNNVTEDDIVFEGLSAGNYSVKAVWGGQSQTSLVNVGETTVGDLELTAFGASEVCDASGKIKVELKNGTILEDGTLEFSLSGTIVRTVPLKMNEREKTVGNLMPGYYTVTYRTACGASTSAEINVLVVQTLGSGLGFTYTGSFTSVSFCNGRARVPITYSGDASDPGLMNFLENATYEIYKDDHLVTSGKFPGLSTSSEKILYTYELGLLTIKIIPSCGYPILSYKVNAQSANMGDTGITDLKAVTPLSESIKKLPSCSFGGTVMYYNNSSEEADLSIIKKHDGTVVASDHVPGNGQLILSDIPEGEYTIDVTMKEDCAGKKVTYHGALSMKRELQVSGVYTSPSCHDDGKIQLSVFPFAGGQRVLTLRKGGTVIREVKTTMEDITMDGIPAGTYQLTITQKEDHCPDISKEVETTVQEGKSNVYIRYDLTKRGTFCEEDGEIEAYLAGKMDQIPASVGTVTWKILDFTTRAVLDTQTAPSKITHVHFNHLGEGQYILRAELDCPIEGNVYLQGYALPSGADLVEVIPVPPSPGCQDGKLKVVSHLHEKGYTDKATQITVEVAAQGQLSDGRIVETRKSSTIMKTEVFEGLTSDVYRITYIYCGHIFQYDVQMSDVFRPELSARVKSNAPCEDAVVNVGLKQRDGSVTVTYEATNKSTGVKYAPVSVNGAESAQFSLEPGDYTIVGKVQGKCTTGEAKTELHVPDPSLTVTCEYPYSMDCPNSGYIRLSVPAPTKATHISYTLSKEGGTTETRSTNDPTEVKEFIGLTAGKYTITAQATCQVSPSAPVRYYNWKKEVQFYSDYTPLQGYNLPSAARGSSACSAHGSLGLDITGGNSKNYHVYITKDPNGIVSPEREIKRFSEEYDMRNTWGTDLAPGNYSLRIWDGCTSRTVPTATVPLIPDVAFPGTGGCVTIKENTLEFRNVALYLFDIPSEAQRQAASDTYEVTAVPIGGSTSGAKWASSWNNYPYSYNDWRKPGRPEVKYAYNNTPLTVDYFDPYNGYDLVLRLKGCPSSEHRVTVTTPEVCCMNIASDDVDCHHKQYYVYGEDWHHAYDIVFVNRTTGVEVVRKTFTLPRGGTQRFDDPDLLMSTRISYDVKLYLHGSTKPLCSFSTYATGDEINLEAMVGRMTSDCSGEYYTWKAKSDCPVRGRFIVYDWDTGVKLVENTEYGMTWKCPYYFLRNKSYRIDMVDEAGHTLFSTPYKHTVSYATPDRYVVKYRYYQPDNQVLLGDQCNSDMSALNDISVEARWNGSPSDWKKRIAKVSRIEVKSKSDGTLWYSTDIQWNQIEGDRDNVHGSNWKMRLPSGVESDGMKLSPGAYTLTVTDDCGVRSTDFTITYKAPVVIDLSESTVKQQCDGRFDIVPKGRAYFPDRPEPVTIVSYEVRASGGGQQVWGTSFSTYEKYTYITLHLKFANGATCDSKTWSFDLSRYVLAFDASQSINYFCTDSHKGQIYIAVTGGKPPYTYTLTKKDGTVLETKTGLSGGAYFERGQLNEVYRIDATDACGLTHIYQDVSLQDPQEIGYAMSRVYDLCEGEPAQLSAVNFPGATYTWTHPDGSITHDKEVKITTSAATGGRYKVRIKPSTCTTTIDANIDVNVARVKESWKHANQSVCAGQRSQVDIGAPTVTVNGAPVTTANYQWQVCNDTTVSSNWKGIAGATAEQLDYAPPYAGTYYVRRLTTQGSCTATSYASKIEATPGLTATISPEEQNITIDHKNPFTLTAGLLSGDPHRTYLWQRSLDGIHWTNVGSDVTFTETVRYATVQYYRRITTAGACTVETPLITVRFKKRYPALINPQLRQRVKSD